MAERTAEDVKLRPIPGDVLRKVKPREMWGTRLADEYEVIEVTMSGLGVYLRAADGPYRGCSTRKHLKYFCKWARPAEVIHIAQPAGTAGEEA